MPPTRPRPSTAPDASRWAAYHSAAWRALHAWVGAPRPRKLAFKTLEQKARWLDAAASLDSALKYVRAHARSLCVPNVMSPLAQAVSLHRFWRDAIAYRTDVGRGPSHEEFADTETVLRRGYDDCDGKARGFVAEARAVGLDARIRPVFPRPSEFRHVQAEIRFPGSAALRGAQPGGWLLVELIVRGVPLGSGPDSVPKRGGKYDVATGPDGAEGFGGALDDYEPPSYTY